MYYTYIVASDDEAVLFIGVTQDLQNQLVLHWYDHFESFQSNVRVHKLLWYQEETRAAHAVAIARRLRKMAQQELRKFLSDHKLPGADLNTRLFPMWPPTREQIRAAVEWKQLKHAIPGIRF